MYQKTQMESFVYKLIEKKNKKNKVYIEPLKRPKSWLWSQSFWKLVVLVFAVRQDFSVA